MAKRIYCKELECYKKLDIIEKDNRLLYPNSYFDLDKLPTESIKDEMEKFIISRGEKLSAGSVRSDLYSFNLFCRFISDKYPAIKSFRDIDIDEMIRKIRSST